MMKGQTYLILTIIMITILVVLKLSLNLSEILESNRRLQANLDTLETKNIERGTRLALINSYNMSNRSDNVNSFIEFARLSEYSRGSTLSGISVQTQHPNVSAGTNTSINVSVYNYLGLSITNLTLKWGHDNSSQTFTDVADGVTKTLQFSFNTSSGTEYRLTIYYQAAGTTTTKAVNIPVDIGRSKLTGFYSIKLSTGQSETATEFTHTVNLNQTQYT